MLSKASMSSGNEYCIRLEFSENEFFVPEFRKMERVFENRIVEGKKIVPGTGLVIYKIDMRISGNGEHNSSTVFNEVAITNHSRGWI